MRRFTRFFLPRFKMADRSQVGKIIVKNYPTDTTEVDLRIMFEKYGKIQDCKLCVLIHAF